MRLQNDGILPRSDGKASGSIVEMVFFVVNETHTFPNLKIAPLKINPTRGVDLLVLKLSLKSPSKDFCTSVPHFFADDG